MRNILALAAAVVATIGVIVTAAAGARAVVPAIEILTATGGLPPNIVGQFREPAAFIQTDDGRYVVYDRRAQIVYAVDAAKKTVSKLIAIGPSDGEILRPLAFAASQRRTLLILDNPGEYERVQVFHDTGTALSVFRRFPESADALHLNVDAMLSSGLGTVSAIDTDVLTQSPDGKSLISQYTPNGVMTRRIGTLRPTGHENDRELHLAMNSGIPLAAPDGSIYFVFTAGVPMFRKYAADGRLLYERHIEGPELDTTLQSLPSVWPKRTVKNIEFPMVASTVASATIDPQGRLWVTLTLPFTYVYDADGNKTRTVQFRGAGVLMPRQLFFTKDGRILAAPGCYEFPAG